MAIEIFVYKKIEKFGCSCLCHSSYFYLVEALRLMMETKPDEIDFLFFFTLCDKYNILYRIFYIATLQGQRHGYARSGYGSTIYTKVQPDM